jgi:two-component system NarL family sensor kinase
MINYASRRENAPGGPQAGPESADRCCEHSPVAESALARIAEQIHDGPLQDLAALSLSLRSLRVRVTDELAGNLADLEELVQAAVEKLRGVVATEAAEITEIDLLQELTELKNAFVFETAIPCRTDLHLEHTQIGPLLAQTICRCMRELLRNVAKHSLATSVHIGSSRDSSGFYVFSVTDDGVGMSPISIGARPDHGDGFGLRSINRGLACFGGWLEVDGSRGVSARIFVPDCRESLAQQ